MTNYRPIIGLEIHVELKTKCGMFCQCRVGDFSAKPNTHVCPVCLGLPGALPVPNKQAIEWTILLGKALNCTINNLCKFDRKHYFYPDLPKGYQISQYDEPIASRGSVMIKDKKFKIHRVHLEEDTGKLIHLGNETLIDFNRSGTPLVEIVTEPDFNNSDDVKQFLEELQTIVRYLGISDADMEKGTMRLEPNISLGDKGYVSGGKLPEYKVEVKNINSFKFVKQAIEYEIKRQMEILETGKLPKQETRGYDEKKGATYSQRSKEEAHDYRYFPEPDIPPMIFTKKYIEDIKAPELPSQKVEKYIKEYGLNEESAFRITRDIKIALHYEQLILKIKNQIPKIQIKNPKFAQFVANLIINKKIDLLQSTESIFKRIIELLQPKETNMDVLNISVARMIKVNPKVVADYKGGKENAIMYLVGQVMKEMKGKADAKTVISHLKDQINKL